MNKYDVVIIGAGSAGLAARKEVAKLTQNYLVIDQGPLGTTCARVGCMPSKALIAAANIFHDRAKFSEIGISGGQSLKIDDEKFMTHVRKLRDHFVGGVLEGMDGWKKTNFLHGRATFTGPDAVEVDGKQIQANRFIIATGSKPIFPDPFKATKGLLTTDSVFEIKALPKNLAVIGLGAVGLELSQGFARAGVKVSAFAKGDSIGGLTSPKLVDLARAELAKEFSIHETQVEKVEKVGEQFRLKFGSKSELFDQVLVAAGRAPTIESLNLEKAGVKFDGKKLKFSKESMRAEGTQVYFAGDVDAIRAVLHEAVDQGRIAGFNSVREQDESFAPKVGLKITFSHPNIAVVGSSFLELRKSYREFRTGLASFSNQGRATLNLENAGAIEIYSCPKGIILGAEIFAPAGEHLAHLIAWAMQNQLNVFKILANPFYHPTIEEGIKPALQQLADQVKDQPTPVDQFRCDSAPVA